MSYVVAGYLATAVVLGGYLSWIVIRSRDVASRLLAAAPHDAGADDAAGGSAT